MKTTPVYDSYWRFAAERQQIFFRRLTTRIGPWTNDPILATYRFTNAFRAADRVSQYLIGRVQYDPNRSQEIREVFFRTMLFKIFNRIDTWESIERKLGPVSWEKTEQKHLISVLDDLMLRGKRIYSPAYIMPAPAFGHSRKHANHIALLNRMMEDRLPDRIRQAPDLKSVYQTLLSYPGIGPFLAFQYTIDLNYSHVTSHDEGSYVVAGPGALDGIAKCFSETGNRSPEEIIHWVCDRQEFEFEKAGLHFQSLYGRRLQPIDCQNLFCEISKYARVAHPDVAGLSGRTRIKQSFKAYPLAVPPPMFPPKWGLTVPFADDTHSVEFEGRFELVP